MSTFKASRLVSALSTLQTPLQSASTRAAAIAADDSIVVSVPGSAAETCVRVPVTDDAGADRAALRQARSLLVPSGTSTHDLDCALLTHHLHIFPLTLAGEAAKARDAAVVAQVRTRLSYPLAEAVIDYHELPPDVQRSGDDGVNVLVYAVHRPVVDGILDRLGGAGWNVGRLLTPGAGLAPLGEAEGRRLLLASTRSTLALSVIEKNSVLMERIVPWGVDRLVTVVADRLDLPASVARRLLHGDVGDAEPVTTLRAVQEILGPLYRDIVREATACLGYCTSTLRPERTSDFWLVGPLADAPGFAHVLQVETGAERTDSWCVDPTNDSRERADSLRHAFQDSEARS